MRLWRLIQLKFFGLWPIKNLRKYVLMKVIVYHILYPLFAPALLVALYFTPKTTFGCANRGYMAIALVFISLGLAFWSTYKARKKQKIGKKYIWWVVTTFILILPALLLLGPLR
jgi:hypothetical protein